MSKVGPYTLKVTLPCRLLLPHSAHVHQLLHIMTKYQDWILCTDTFTGACREMDSTSFVLLALKLGFMPVDTGSFRSVCKGAGIVAFQFEVNELWVYDEPGLSPLCRAEIWNSWKCTSKLLNVVCLRGSTLCYYFKKNMWKSTWIRT
jgi:hypothetical protein